MCMYCTASARSFVLFDFASQSCDHANRYILADILSFVQDALRRDPDNEFELTPAGCDGLGLILGAVEQALRFDIESVRPATKEE